MLLLGAHSQICTNLKQSLWAELATFCLSLVFGPCKPRGLLDSLHMVNCGRERTSVWAVRGLDQVSGHRQNINTHPQLMTPAKTSCHCHLSFDSCNKDTGLTKCCCWHKYLIKAKCILDFSKYSEKNLFEKNQKNAAVISLKVLTNLYQML